MNNPQAQEVTKYIEQLPVMELVQDPIVSEKFIELYNAVHGADIGESIYQTEQFNFMKQLNENPKLQKCTGLSLYGCFLDVAVKGLSLDNSNKPTCYIIPRSVKSGRKDDRGYVIRENRAILSITGFGELLMRQRAKHVKYADNPVIVYEGDFFEAELDASGRKTIRYKATIPRKSKKIIAAFIRITRLDGSIDWQWLLEDDIDRLKEYSEKNNSYYDKNGNFVKGDANKLYTSFNGGIDPGFLENKMIKHAFDAYPKIKAGEFAQFETEQEPEKPIDYGINTSTIKKVDDAAEDAKVIPEDENFGGGDPIENFNNDVTVDDENF